MIHEGVDENKKKAAAILYNARGGKVGVSLSRKVAGLASKACPQQTDEGLWKAERAIPK
jgi:hypothetical protein